MATPVDDDFTELTDADIARIDLVLAPANGMAFILTKSAATPVPLKKALHASTSAPEQARLANDMHAAAAAVLARIHQRP